jgi:hypothetical protein
MIDHPGIACKADIQQRRTNAPQRSKGLGSAKLQRHYTLEQLDHLAFPLLAGKFRQM